MNSILDSRASFVPGDDNRSLPIDSPDIGPGGLEGFVFVRGGISRLTVSLFPGRPGAAYSEEEEDNDFGQ